MSSSVIGIVFNPEKTDVLVLQRRDVAVWVLPGGGVDAGETPEEAVVREIEEETKLQVAIKRKAAEYLPQNALTTITHVYECEVISGTLSPTSESRLVGFYPIQSLPEPFFHVHQDWLKDALENPSKMVQKPITQVTYGKLFTYFLRYPGRTFRYLLSKLGIPVNSK